FRLFLTVAKGLGVLDYRIDGAEILRQERGCLVVANHPTLIDYVLLASVMPETDCLVKSALLKNPFLGGAVRAADYLLNSEAETLLPRCQQRLAQGDTILIFPEGTRTKPGEKMTLQRGAANIAVRCA
ncbi:1-acyl-sn-glycerol-3-phosphate acyltransferase, partial [Escherichia coli]|nr:1-acyl-sn-glycerol-3-phosphate acyltransferase [Escherichia coli]